MSDASTPSELRLSDLLSRARDELRRTGTLDRPRLLADAGELADELGRQLDALSRGDTSVLAGVGDSPQHSAAHDETLLHSRPQEWSPADESCDTRLVPGKAASPGAPLLSPPQAPDEIGRLGDYRILRELGFGGMGVVYLGEDAGLRRKVALKVMRPELASPDTIERFFLEARAAAALKHDHIVTIYQLGHANGAPFVAMEFLEGESLDQRLKRDKVLPVAEALRITRETLLGLQAAHERGMVHRDIKPANLWMERLSDERSRVKILDFGLARAEADQQLTASGMMIGTPAYMAPEQARGEKVDARCDLFAVGCVLYRMLTGKQPFQGPDLLSTLSNLATVTPLPVFKLDATIPREVSDIIEKLMTKDRDGRPASAREVIVELDRATAPAAAHHLETSSPRSMPHVSRIAAALSTGTPAPPATPTGENWWPIVVAVALIAGAVPAAMYLPGMFLKSKSPEVASRPTQKDVPTDIAKHDLPAVPAKPTDSPQSKSNPDEATTPELPAKAGTTSGTPPEPAREPKPETKGDPPPKPAEEQPRPTVSFSPLDPEWVQLVQGLTWQEQVQEVAAELKRRNPEFDGKAQTDEPTKAGDRFAFRCNCDYLTDILPLQALPQLTHLELKGTAGEHTDRHVLKDIRPLKGLKLQLLNLHQSAVDDLSPLAEMPLQGLALIGLNVGDLAPLGGLKTLKNLVIFRCPVIDLSPLADLPVETLLLSGLDDLEDISHLGSMPELRVLRLAALPKVSDFSPLEELKLTDLMLDDPEASKEILVKIATLKTINEKPAADVLKGSKPEPKPPPETKQADASPPVPASPFDALDPANIPEAERFPWQPKELVGVLGTHADRHWGQVFDVAAIPQTRLVAVAAGHLVSLRDVDSGKVTVILHGHPDSVSHVVASRDGKLLASSNLGSARTVKLWDVATGQEKLSIAKFAPIGAVFSPDGTTLAIAGPKVVEFFDTSKGEKSGEIAVSDDSVDAVAYNADGTRLVTGDRKGVAKLWDVAANSEVWNRGGHAGPIVAVEFRNGDKEVVVTAGGEQTQVKRWNADSGSELGNFTARLSVFRSAISKDGKRIALAGSALQVHDVDTGRLQKTLTGHRANVLAAQFLDGDKTLVTAGEDGTFRVWNHVDGTHRQYPENQFAARNVAVSTDGGTIAVVQASFFENGRGVELFEVTGKSLERIATTDDATSAAWSPDGFKLAIGSVGKILVFNRVINLKVQDLPVRQRSVDLVLFSPDGQTMLTFGGDAELWNAETGEKLGSVPARSVCATPDGSELLVLLSGKELARFDRATLARNENGTVTLVETVSQIATDGKRLFAIGAGLKSYDLSTGKVVKEFPSTRAPKRVAVASDGTLIAWAGLAGEIVVADSQGEVRHKWKFPNDDFGVPAFAPDSRHLFVANRNGTVYILRLTTEG